MRESLSKAYELYDSGIDHISPAQAGAILGVDGASLKLSACAGNIGLPYIITGRNVRIGVAGIIRFLQGGIDPVEKPDRIKWENMKRKEEAQ